MAKTRHSKIPHQNTKVLVDLKENKPALDALAEKKGILPTTLATILLVDAVKKGAKR